jgi:Niemann-Pick C1 protein
VFPLVCILFVDLLGALQWAGLHINPVSYVSLAMSLGLLVDYIIHIIFRFYEETGGNRREKTVSMLRTMGVSILLGGATTWLGTMPLMFSSSDVFETVYVTFLGIVLLGMGHGLILLPVLLSLFGPEIQVSKFDTTNRQTVDAVQANLPA